VTSIDRTAYPRFGRFVSARELEGLTPLAEEVEWARSQSRSDEHTLALLLGLKCFQRLGYFPRGDQLPKAVVERVHGSVRLPRASVLDVAQRTAEWQRALVRDRVGALLDPARARSLAEQAIRAEAELKNHPPDLINVALDVLVRERLELPGFSTLDEIAGRVRAEVNRGMLSGIVARMSQPEVLRANGLLEQVESDGKTRFDWLKRSAGKASWSHFREQVEHMRWAESLGDARGWVEGIAESKVADFAGEAAVADAAVMKDVSQSKRTALLACLIHVAQTRARDELAEMFCKRMALITSAHGRSSGRFGRRAGRSRSG
jgi:hypothetical protein